MTYRCLHAAIDALCLAADAIDPNATESGESGEPIAHYLTMIALQLNMIADEPGDPLELLCAARRTYPC